MGHHCQKCICFSISHRLFFCVMLWSHFNMSHKSVPYTFSYVKIQDRLVCRNAYKKAIWNTSNKASFVVGLLFFQTTADGCIVRFSEMVCCCYWLTFEHICAYSCACNKFGLALTISNDSANYVIQALLVPTAVVFPRPQVPATKPLLTNSLNAWSHTVIMTYSFPSLQPLK